MKNATPTKPCRSEVVLAEFRATSEFIFAVSPDGTRTVGWRYRKQGPDHEELVVRDVATGRDLQMMSWPERVLRVNWRPDSRALAYFRQDSKTNLRRLFIWDLESDRHREIPIPESYAQPLVRWSPDGRRLAFTCTPDALAIVDPSGGGHPIVYPEKIRTFDWNTDGTKLAIVTDEDSSTITILRAAGSTFESSRLTQSGGQLVELVWQRSPRLLLKPRSGKPGAGLPAAAPALIALDPKTGAEEKLASDSAAMRDIQWLPDGTGFLWHQRKADGSQSIYLSKAGTAAPRHIDLGGTVRLNTFFSDGQSMAVSRISDTVNQLVRIPLSGGNPALIVEVPSVQLPGLKEEVVHAPSADGKKVPMLVTSIAEGHPRANAAHIVIYGANLTIHNETWAETQRCLRHGIHSIHLANRRGSAVPDLIAACEYARTVLKVPRERIVVQGKSEGAKVVMEAALLRPDLFGVIVLTGAFAVPDTVPKPRPAGLAAVRVLAFHGEKDRVVSPENGRSVIEKSLGAEALLPPRGMWHVAPNEDHPLHLIESQAMIFATILRELGLIENR